MNKSWSELNRKMQIQLKKEATFSDGIEPLFELRKELMQAADGFFRDFNREEFCAMPFINAEGYHSKTVAYSFWHIFRIEDIVANTLITGCGQVFFRGNYKERTNSPYHNRKRTCKTADCRIFTTAESWRASKLHPRSQSPN